MNRTLYSSLMLLILLGAPQIGFAGDPLPTPPTISKEFGKKGSKSDITALQEILKYLGKDVQVNGKFDEKTKKALSDFRKEKGLPNSDGSGTFPAYVSTPVKDALYASWNEKQTKEANDKLAFEKASSNAVPAKTEDTKQPSPVTTPSIDKLSYLSPDDLSEFGLKLEFVGYNLEATGSLPEECAKRLKYGDRREFGAESPSSANAVSSADDLALRSRKVGVQIIFRGDEKEKSLAECMEKHKDDKKNSVKLKKYVDHTGKAMIAGLLDESDEFSAVEPRVTSPTFKKLELAIGNCPECDKNPELTRELIDEVNGLDYSFLVGTQKELIRKSLSHIEKAIKNAKSLSELKRLRSELMDLAKQVDRLSIDGSDKESMLSAISADFDLLLEANQRMAAESRKACSEKTTGRSFYKGNTCGGESNHADFIASTHDAISQLPGLDAASRDSERRLADEFSQGGLSRVDFISNLDPAHEEVVDALNNGKTDLRYLSMNVQRSCAWLTPATFASCNQAKYDYQQTLQTYQTLSQRYSSLQSMSQIGPGYMQPNGFAPNGFAPNGFAPNGFAPNGFAPNGFAPNGFAPNGFAPNGFAPNGFAPNGFAPNGFASNTSSQGNGFQYAMFPQVGTQQPQQGSFVQPGNFLNNGMNMPTAVPLNGNFNSWNQPSMF